MIAALKEDESHSDRCAEIIGKVPGQFILSEPSIVYWPMVWPMLLRWDGCRWNRNNGMPTQAKRITVEA